jgi:hypothetical protein
MTNPGGWLRQRREELHLTRIGVERLTNDSANGSSNERYRIRRGRLADLEEGRSAPDIFEVASLCVCYKVTYPAVLHAFGMKLGEPLSFDATRLVTESAQELGIPAVVRQRLDLGQFRLGIIGINDDTMGELLPSGSVVVIDTSRTTVEMGEWKSIRDRPIYFVWHENGYSCSWCNLVRENLFIIPYPTSRQPAMIFKVPRAATVIGRIVHIWSPLIIKKTPM